MELIAENRQPNLAQLDDTLKTSNKRQKVDESFELLNLPNAQSYEQSFMHREPVLHILVSQKFDFVFTASSDGYLKFWRKAPQGIEPVRTYRAHMQSIDSMAISHNEERLATCCPSEQSIKIFDVVNFDLMNMIKLNFTPLLIEFVCVKSSFQPLLAVTEKESATLRIIKTEQPLVEKKSEGNQVVHREKQCLHDDPITFIKFNPWGDFAISFAGGVPEVWHPETFDLPSKFQLLSDTDLFMLCDRQVVAAEFSENYLGIVTSDMSVWIFSQKDLTLVRVLDESAAALLESKEIEDLTKLAADIDRRTKVENELIQDWQKGLNWPSISFDETGDIICVSTAVGLKLLNVRTNKVLRMIGKGEQQRFVQAALFQGKAQRSVGNLGSMSVHNKTSSVSKVDPIIFCSAFKENRFYLFTRREPTQSSEQGRDFQNERLTGAQTHQQQKQIKKKTLPSQVVIYTSKGEIYCELFPEECPKTVENFITHSKNGYYNNLIFHRVIKGFMAQTGDPEGDGTGGESIWGHEFQDEISPNCKHEQPFTLSMANCGPGTNASQFFITTVPCPWLDGKHTVFGRVTKGMSAVTDIEQVRVDKDNKPLIEVKLHSIRVKEE